LELLEQESVQGHIATNVRSSLRALHGLDALINFDFVEIWGQKLDKLIFELLLDFFLAGLATNGAGLLGLGLNEHDDHLHRFLKTISQISVTIEAENKRVIFLRHG